MPHFYGIGEYFHRSFPIAMRKPPGVQLRCQQNAVKFNFFLMIQSVRIIPSSDESGTGVLALFRNKRSVKIAQVK